MPSRRLGASRAATRLRVRGRDTFSLPSPERVRCGIRPLAASGPSHGPCPRWHRGSAAEALLHPTSSCDTSRTVSCSLPSAHLVTHPTRPRCYAPPRRARPSDNASLRVPRWQLARPAILPYASPLSATQPRHQHRSRCDAVLPVLSRPSSSRYTLDNLLRRLPVNASSGLGDPESCRCRDGGPSLGESPLPPL